MHEMSLAEGVLQVIEGSAKSNGFTQVKTVWLEIGELSGADAEAMRFCFEHTHAGLAHPGQRFIQGSQS